MTKEMVLMALSEYDTIIVFDLETTGFSPQKNHIIQIAAKRFHVSDNHMCLAEELNMYVNPGYRLPPKIIEITGITDAMLASAPAEKEAFPIIREFFGNAPVLCGYNSKCFDSKFMDALYARYDDVFRCEYMLDILDMARDIVPKTESASHALGHIATLYGADHGLTFHNAMDDVTASARLLQIFIDEYMEIEDKTKQEQKPKKIARVYRMRYWQGYRGKSRIYIATDLGAFYYDILSQTWDKKPDNPYDINEIDMERLRADCFAMANVTTEREFAKYGR